MKSWEIMQSIIDTSINVPKRAVDLFSDVKSNIFRDMKSNFYIFFYVLSRM